MLERCDYATQTRIVEYLDDRLEQCKNPRHFGEALKGNKMGLWRYRVGDYRIICEIIDEQLIVLAIAIGHRKSYL
jgi:mRNA interferase RelE/StbE